MNEPQVEMPLYESNKVVWALKIAKVDPKLPGLTRIQCQVHPADEGYAPFDPGEDWWTRFHGTPDDLGYYVQYQDGYTSWSPSKAFEDGYVATRGSHTRMSFGRALAALRRGFTVRRNGWNGKGMFIYLVPGSTFTVDRAPLLWIYSEDTTVDYLPHIDMRTAGGQCVPWVASQTDILAEDWVTREHEES